MIRIEKNECLNIIPFVSVRSEITFASKSILILPVIFLSNQTLSVDGISQKVVLTRQRKRGEGINIIENSRVSRNGDIPVSKIAKNLLVVVL